MLNSPPQLHLTVPCGVCVGHDAEHQWVCGCRHMSQPLSLHGGAPCRPCPAANCGHASPGGDK
jgi:hypothetical protein